MLVNMLVGFVSRLFARPDTLRIALGVALVIVSAIPWGVSEGWVIAMERSYRLMPVLRASGLLFLAFGTYFLGFMIAPINVVIVAALWEVGAIVSAIITAGVDKALTWEKAMWFVVIASGVVVISTAGHKLYELYNIP